MNLFVGSSHTNVLVSAAISQGKARDIFNKGVEEEKFSLISSEPILEELTTVLRRPKFKMSSEETDEIILALIQTAELVTISSDLDLSKKIRTMILSSELHLMVKRK
jgi:putative PIN family toxin of toxin-antitoxin system